VSGQQADICLTPVQPNDYASLRIGTLVRPSRRTSEAADRDESRYTSETSAQASECGSEVPWFLVPRVTRVTRQIMRLSRG
jgi:hypothetical protein